MKKVIKRLEYILEFIEETKEYYHDGVDEDLKDMINLIIKEMKGE